MAKKALAWLALAAYCGLIFALSAQEKLPVPQVFDFQDKGLHLGAYFVMAVFSWRAFRYIGWSEKTIAWMSFLFCSIYGISDEWHQSFVPGRSVSAWDWAADTLGAALASYSIIRFRLLPLNRSTA